MLVLLLLASVLGGGGWVLAAALGGPGAAPEKAAAAPAAAISAAPSGVPSGATAASAPALDRVVPDLAGVTLPTAAAGTAPPAAGPVPGAPCGDDAISVTVTSDVATAPAGSRPTFTLVVTNTSAVPCARALDGALREMVVVDAAGGRVWGSNDCETPGPAETRTLGPGEAASFPLQWSGRTSAPGCSATRTTAPAGSYVLRGRLDTKTSTDVALTLT